MSVLSSIKGTIVNVKQDIAESLNRLTVGPVAQGKSVETVTDGSASADLLHRYTDCWKQIHQNSEDLALRAQGVDTLVSNVHRKFDRQNEAMNHFLSELSSVTQLVNAITTVNDRLGMLDRGCTQLELLLMELEDACEEQEQRARSTYHEAQLRLYRQRRSRDLELTKAKLAVEHGQQVKRLEAHMSSILAERQKVFDAAHNEQMEHYKKSGQLNNARHPPVITGGFEPNLADIVVEDDVGDLEKFLEDTTHLDATGDITQTATAQQGRNRAIPSLANCSEAASAFCDVTTHSCDVTTCVTETTESAVSLAREAQSIESVGRAAANRPDTKPSENEFTDESAADIFSVEHASIVATCDSDFKPASDLLP